MRDELPLLLTADETAKILRTTKKAIYVMVERRQLPGVTRVGRRVLVRSETLLKWLDQQATPSLLAGESKHSSQHSVTQTGRRRNF